MELDTTLEINDLISAKPRIYKTGINAIITQKRIDATLQRIHTVTGRKFITDRVQYEGREGITAQSRILHGRTPPKYG